MAGLRTLTIALGLSLLPTAVLADITIIRPPQHDSSSDEQPVPETKVVKKQSVTNNYVVVINPYLSGQAIADRALFQTWTGFYKVYSGRQYPF